MTRKRFEKLWRARRVQYRLKNGYEFTKEDLTIELRLRASKKPYVSNYEQAWKAFDKCFPI